MPGLKLIVCVSFVSLSLFSQQAFAAQLSTSTEVQDNVRILKETKNCPNCDLRGANLNRFDLSGANLEGANLSRASLSLSNFSGANLRNADLREAMFNGADLANADMRGADLTGASLVGSYMKGTLMDGEIVQTQPYAELKEISGLVEDVYIEDTVKPKTSQELEEITIAKRRDFEESPPIVPESSAPPKVVVAPPASIPQQSAAAPDVKAVPSIQDVNIANQNPPIQGQTAQSEPERGGAAASPSDEDTKPEIQSGNNSPTGAVPVILSSEKQGVKAEQDEMETEQVIADVTKKESSDIKSSVQEKDQEPLGIVDSALGMVESMFGDSDEGKSPQTETIKNVDLLLDVNKCYGCNLDGAILSGEDLEDADLEGASLKGAKLSGADLQNANLKGADLSGADLSGTDLSGADLYRAILTGADLSNATLDGTKLDDADLSRVKGYQEQNIMLMQ